MANIIFFHVAIINNWKDIFNEIYTSICDSGLIHNVDKINIGVVGDQVIAIDNPKVQILHYGNLNNCEFPTLQQLIDHCKENPFDNVLYIHTKGVSAPLQNKEAIDDWRKYMLYFVVNNFNMCLEKLKSYHVCGVDWVESPVKHFSGNFWWARASYINTLPLDWQDKYILTKRHNCEFLIGMNNNVKSWSLHNSNINVYERHLHTYKREQYELRTISN